MGRTVSPYQSVDPMGSSISGGEGLELRAHFHQSNPTIYSPHHCNQSGGVNSEACPGPCVVDLSSSKRILQENDANDTAEVDVRCKFWGTLATSVNTWYVVSTRGSGSESGLAKPCWHTG
jgi:hypothetical protein